MFYGLKPRELRPCSLQQAWRLITSWCKTEIQMVLQVCEFINLFIVLILIQTMLHTEPSKFIRTL